ncbi:uncharacterized protein LOC129318041 isoform X2 [Prosopis cineraria]|uniref:uncharacterized protein LOC129318041 isoform X2 n=1 Tax=Prosopis cineraria TaxID=364024 RepID=UPI00240F1E33|nr:uncharacterized protein LOC129318041 isoform X2 [Prosopis cineraria]
MEQKCALLSALSVGVGLGVGLGLSSGQVVQKWVGRNRELSGEQIELELLRLVIDGKECKETFDEFPYYLSKRTRELLTNAAFVHLKQLHFSKHTRNLSPASRAILLSGPTELYMQKLAKALAQHFESKLLLLDIPDFSFKVESKHGCAKKEPSFQRSLSEVTLERVSSLFGSFSVLPSTGKTKGILRAHSNSTGSSNASPKLSSNASTASDMSPLKNTSSLCLDEKLFIQSLYKVLVSVSEKSSIILYIRDAEKIFLQSERLYNLFHKMLEKLSGPVMVIGSQILDSGVDESPATLFPYNIGVKPPEDDCNALQEDNMKIIQFQDNKKHIAEVLAANDIECNDLNSICHADTRVLSKYIEEIVVSAIHYYLMNTTDPEYRNGKLVISSESLSHGLNLFQEGNSSSEDTLKLETSGKKEVPPDNEFEKHIRPEVIPANEIGVTFADIGALDEIKESLQELVMLPLRRPDLFKGGLLKPCRGILLFGPPGTGKTMLAKAIANEAGASFINISMSTITSKWFGEDEKNVRALFTLAAKVAPTIIFVDEVDSMLGQRTRVGEHEAMRKIKNEFMMHWDGLLTKPGEQILVLAATNRPFDLDEAIIRRFERRIMVGLPSVENREMILKTLLAKEKTENLDFKDLAIMTEGYSGSDIKHLCTTAAYRPVRELMKQERLKDMEKNKKAAAEQCSEDASDTKGDGEERVITLRPLNMEDMRQAKSQGTIRILHSHAISRGGRFVCHGQQCQTSYFHLFFYPLFYLESIPFSLNLLPKFILQSFLGSNGYCFT